MTQFFKKARGIQIILVLLTGLLFSSCDKTYFKKELFPQVQELQNLPPNMYGKYYSDKNDVLELAKEGGRLQLLEDPEFYDAQTHNLHFGSNSNMGIKDLKGFYLVHRLDPYAESYEYFVVLHKLEEESLIVYTLFGNSFSTGDTDLIKEVTPIEYNEVIRGYLLQPTEEEFLEMMDKGYFEKVMEFKKVRGDSKSTRPSEPGTHN